MSVETLRRAAALMRERAEEPVAQPDRWPQIVAPAVAGWLDVEAEVMAADDSPERAAALAVANAYLGDTDPDG